MGQVTVHDANGDVVGTKDGQLQVVAEVETEFERESEAKSNSYTWSIVAYTSSNADTLLAVRNDSDTLKLHITSIGFSSDAASEYDIHCTDEASFTMAGTTVTGVNVNRATQKVADATAFADETGNTQGNIIWTGYVGANLWHEEEFSGALILSKNQVIALDQTTGSSGANARCTIKGYFKAT